MNENANERPVTRRGLLGIGVAGGAALLVGCGSGGRSESGWSFVDDRKHTVGGGTLLSATLPLPAVVSR